MTSSGIDKLAVELSPSTSTKFSEIVKFPSPLTSTLHSQFAVFPSKLHSDSKVKEFTVKCKSAFPLKSLSYKIWNFVPFGNVVIFQDILLRWRLK